MLDDKRHETFAQEIVQGTKPFEAYLRAGFKVKSEKVAGSAASRLLKNVDVRARIDELTARIPVGLVITRQSVLEEYAQLAYADKTDNNVPVSVKRAALQDIARMQGWIIERSENGKPGDFSRMDDKELEQFIANHKAAIPANLNKRRA